MEWRNPERTEGSKLTKTAEYRSTADGCQDYPVVGLTARGRVLALLFFVAVFACIVLAYAGR